MSKYIEQDKAIDKLRRRKALFCKNQIEFKLLPTNDKSRVDEIDACIAMLINMPPEDVQPVQWIPCSKRLPNDNDYNSCMECIDGAVWYLTEKGAMGLGYYYESTKQWATTDDLKTDGKVVAWMPLPEPWKGSDNENY